MKSAILSNIYSNLLALEKVMNNNIIFRIIWYLNYLQTTNKKYPVYNLNKSIELIKTIIFIPSIHNLTKKDI